jgi:hypothetical protein
MSHKKIGKVGNILCQENTHERFLPEVSEFPILLQEKMRLFQKSKSINRRGRKVFPQRSQRTIGQCFNFALYATTWRDLRLKRTFEISFTPSFNDSAFSKG